MAARRYTAEEASQILFELPGDGDTSDDESASGDEGDVEVDPVAESDSDSDYPEEEYNLP